MGSRGFSKESVPSVAGVHWTFIEVCLAILATCHVRTLVEEKRGHAVSWIPTVQPGHSIIMNTAATRYVTSSLVRARRWY